MSTIFFFLYQLVIRIYGLAIHVAAWFQPKAKLWVNGRTSIFEKLRKSFLEEKSDLLWMHCASLGEFEQGRQLIEQLKEKHPSYKILLTFFSPSGYEIRKNYALADYVFYLPLDTPSNARRFISIVQPKIVFFVKYEFWYFYLKTLKEKQIPYYLIAGVFRPNQLFFKGYGKWYLDVIKGFDKLFLIDENSLAIAKKHNLNQAVLSGDPRIDRVAAIAQNTPPINEIKAFKGDKKLFILGSAHEKDWRLFFDFMRTIQTKSYYADWCFLIAPHEITPKVLTKVEKNSPLPSIRYTNWSTTLEAKVPHLFVLNTIGQLSAAYQYGDIVFIGGGFDKSIHNILEPAAFGLPILFGPNFEMFQEAKALVTQNKTMVIENAKALEVIFENWQIVEERNKVGSINKGYIERNRKSTEKILNYLNLKNV